MQSLGFTAARAGTCEMATSWGWGWVLMSPLSPWNSSWLIPVCILQQVQPAAHFLGHSLGLPGATAGNRINLRNTWKLQGQSLEQKFCEETSCSLRSQVITLRILCLTLIPMLWGSQLLPMSSWLSPGVAWGCRQLPSGQDHSQAPCVLSASIPTDISPPCPLPIFMVWAGMSLSLGFVRLSQIWF